MYLFYAENCLAFSEKILRIYTRFKLLAQLIKNAYIIIVTYIGILPQLINNAYIMKVTCIGILAQLVPPVRPSHLFGRLAIDFGIKRGIK